MTDFTQKPKSRNSAKICCNPVNYYGSGIQQILAEFLDFGFFVKSVKVVLNLSKIQLEIVEIQPQQHQTDFNKV